MSLARSSRDEEADEEEDQTGCFCCRARRERPATPSVVDIEVIDEPDDYVEYYDAPKVRLCDASFALLRVCYAAAS